MIKCNLIPYDLKICQNNQKQTIKTFQKVLILNVRTLLPNSSVKISQMNKLISPHSSLNKNFDKLNQCLKRLNHKFTVIGLTETHLKDKPHDYYNYQIISWNI